MTQALQLCIGWPTASPYKKNYGGSAASDSAVRDRYSGSGGGRFDSEIFPGKSDDGQARLNVSTAQSSLFRWDNE